jgi:hypothetical protein
MLYFAVQRTITIFGLSDHAGSVGDPEPVPAPQDPHVFGPPGSGSSSRRYGSGFGSGSFPFLINA